MPMLREKSLDEYREGQIETLNVGIIDRLERKKKIAEENLEQINAAIEALKANPETVKILDLLRKVGI